MTDTQSTSSDLLVGPCADRADGSSDFCSLISDLCLLKPDVKLFIGKYAEMIDMTDGAIEHGTANAATWFDPETDLEWQCESPGRMNWHAAQFYARSLSTNGKDDWRLPTARELETLLDRTKYRPTIREEVPFRDKLSYWSSTTFGPNKNNAWIVMFDGAYVLSYYKTNEYYVRCVRG